METYIMIDYKGDKTKEISECCYVIIDDSEVGLKDFKKLCKKEEWKISLYPNANETVEFLIRVINRNEEYCFMPVDALTLSAIALYK